MNESIYTAIKFNQEVDVIAFKTWDECITFCNEFNDYEPMGTAIYNLYDARRLLLISQDNDAGFSYE
jgi:hypothetical protein